MESEFYSMSCSVRHRLWETEPGRLAQGGSEELLNYGGENRDGGLGLKWI